MRNKQKYGADNRKVTYSNTFGMNVQTFMYQVSFRDPVGVYMYSAMPYICSQNGGNQILKFSTHTLFNKFILLERP